MRESELQTETLKLARLKQWKIARFPATNVRDGKHIRLPYDTKGSFDTWLFRDRLVVVEFKGEKGKLSDEQLRWQQWLGRAGVENYVWFPRHWLDGTIDKVLA